MLPGPDDPTFGFASLSLEPDPALPPGPPPKQRESGGHTITDIIPSYVAEDGRTYHGWMAGGKAPKVL
jgi:hypothetical protein